MKNISKLLLAGSMIFLFAQAQAAIAQNVQLNSQDAKLSYTIGYQMGRNFNKQKINVDPEVFAKGLNDGIKQSQPMLNESQMKQVLQQFRSEMMAKLQKANAGSSDKNLQMSQEFLQKNKSKQGVVTLPSGLQYKILKKGEGVSPDLSDVVVVNYEGKLIDGKVFDSSYQRGKPATLPVNAVIKGWQEALQLMKPGGEWELYIPPQLAYGKAGAGGLIGPNQALIFKVQLIKVEKK